MKKTFLFLSTIFVVLCSNAQNALFSKDQTWSVFECHFFPEFAKKGCFDICKFFFKDSVIYKGNAYQKIYTGDAKSSYYTGQAFRYDNGRILLYGDSTISLPFYEELYNDSVLLYFDENCKAGATYGITTITKVTDSVFNDGVSRKCWWSNGDIYWIEGIGSFYYGVCNILAFWYLNSRYYTLLSCEQNGDTIFVNNDVKKHYEELLALSVKEIQNDTSVVRTDYYDLSGRHLQSPLPNGVSIEKCFYKDGTVKAKKVVNK